MDFALLPPEINSGRMYTGPGSGPMLAAAAAWDALAAELHHIASAYESVISGLVNGPWLGPASASMAAAVAPYVTWLRTTAMQAEQTASQAGVAASAYESAFASTVPPPVIAANRAQLVSLIATNFLGQNTPAIAAAEAAYAEMWAQDVAAMYGYAAASTAASALTPFTPPAPTTDPAGLTGQAAATTHAVGTPAGAAAQTIMSSGPQLMSAVPATLQGLASSASSADPGAGLTAFATLVTEVAIAVAAADTVAASTSAPASFTSAPSSMVSATMSYRGMLINADRDFAQGKGPFTGNGPGGQALPQWIFGGPAAFGEPSTTPAPSVAAGLGQGTALSGLSVPRGWVRAAPAIRTAALALPFTNVGAAPATTAEIAPAMTAGIPGSMVSGTALAGMAGGAVGNAIGPGRREPVRASSPETRVGPAPRPPGEPAAGISTELRELALAVLRDSGVLTEEEFAEKQRLVGR
ncbi:MAG: PPE domain-containing protein [Mycobacterium sp.]|uniref:PPE family protein, SVP subgroup n=1 Tax=Mycobacterium sp. TaxID=1785 RepID=UPI00261F0705|nr:PPE domain-containing protein [Mycobacterium sp.]MDI3314317.1 PPE domain-containing protein [Mycobacterium sp.]